jgi:TPR repeat protein
VLCLLFASSTWGDVKDGVAAYERGDYNTALNHLQPLAEQGDAEAQHYLGWMYEYGAGVVQDDVTAVKCYTKAAEQGLAEAQRLAHEWKPVTARTK